MIARLPTSPSATPCGHPACLGVAPPSGAAFVADIDPGSVRIVLVSEAQPADPAQGYHAPGDPIVGRTTVAAFNDAGAAVSTVADILRLGVHLTTAVRCAKTGYAIDPATIRACAPLLAAELRGFPNLSAILLMGDVAIRSLNEVARLAGLPRVVPAGPTYRIPVLPSYLQAGPAFFIEKSKRRMIAEDIRRALELVGRPGAAPSDAASDV